MSLELTVPSWQWKFPSSALVPPSPLLSMTTNDKYQVPEFGARIADLGEGKMVKRVCRGSDCFRPFAEIYEVIGSVAFDTAALTVGGDGTRS